VLSERDIQRLQGVHPDLVMLVEMLSGYGPMDFMVIEGVRTVEQQQVNYDSGASQTMNSRHLTGHAVDLGPLVDGQIPWDNWTVFEQLAGHMKGASALCGFPIVWGGDWQMKDGPHFELSWEAYPLPEPSATVPV